MRRHGPVIAHCTDSEDFPEVPSKYATTLKRLTYPVVHVHEIFGTLLQVLVHSTFVFQLQIIGSLHNVTSVSLSISIYVCLSLFVP